MKAHLLDSSRRHVEIVEPPRDVPFILSFGRIYQRTGSEDALGMLYVQVPIEDVWNAVAVAAESDKTQYTVKVNGQPFRCDAIDGQGRCGCNVFHKDDAGRYICNSCSAAYVGES